MKRKRIVKYWFGCLVLLGLTVSCNDELYMGGVGVVPSTKAYYLYANILGFNLPDTVESPSMFNVESQNVPWRLNVADEWLKITPSEGNGEEYTTPVTVRADINPSTYYRYSVFSLEAAMDTSVYKYSQQIWAQQEGNTGTRLSVSCEKPLLFRGGASSETFTVETNAPRFDLRTDASWIKAVASGNEVTVSVEANTTEDVRVGYVYFDAYEQLWNSNSETISSFYLEVRQESPKYSISESSLTFRNTAGTKTVDLECDLGWTASTTDSWIQVSPISAPAGETELTVSVTENGGIQERSGAVYLHVDGDFLIEIPVKQLGLYMDMTESQLDFESDASSQKVSLSTNLSFWNVLEKPSWISVSPENGGGGEHSLTVNVEDNPNTTKREGRVVVGNQGLSLADTLWVTQEGKWFGSLETVLRFENIASSTPLEIQTDGDWTVTASEEWITVVPASGHGNGQVMVNVEGNETDNERTGLLSVAVGGTVKYVNVVQKGRYFTIDKGASASLPSKGGTIELGIATNQTWTAAVKNQSSWLALSATQGEGNAKLVISAQDNPSQESRTDTIVFTPANKQGVKLAVKQAGRYLKTDAQTVSFFYRGGTSVPVTVSTDGTFRVEKSTGADWLVVATNNNLIMFTAEPYSGNDKRTANVSVYLTGLSGEVTEAKIVDIVVTQYSKNTQFVRDDYGEDVRLDVIYKDGAVIVRSDYGKDNDLAPAPNTSGEISRDDYGTDKDLSSAPETSGEISREDYGEDQNLEQ